MIPHSEGAPAPTSPSGLAAAPIAHVGVVGGGLMGSGIAQVAAQAGFTVTVREVSEALNERAKRAIEKSFSKGIEKGKATTADRDAALGRIGFTTSLDALAQNDLIIEAVTEHLETKNAIWKALDALCPAHTIFASNTSSLTIAAMAAVTRRPDRFIGLHFFSPVPVMPLVEVVRTVTTGAAACDQGLAFVRALGKHPILAKDSSGFVVNLLLIPYLLDAITAVERGVASVEDIDRGMQLGAGHPMGPLTLLDFVGLDTAYQIAEIMFTEYRETRYAPPPLLKRMVLVGMLGRKTGKGFFDYSVDPPVPNALGV